MAAFPPCPNCGSEMHVTETRQSPVGIRRRRACDSKTCNGRLSTLEVVVASGSRATRLTSKRMALVSMDDLDELADFINRFRPKAESIL